jgi:repressor LexA
MGLTPKRKKILDYIRAFVNAHGYAPTLEEMAREFGVSRITVHEHLRALEEMGVLRRTKYRARAIEINDELPAQISPRPLPFMGLIAAGKPIEAVEDRQMLDLSELLRSKGEQFVLQVRGDSMIDEQIRDGDYVIIERRDQALNGETVVALINGSHATLKKFYREKNGRLRLQAANPNVPPLYPENVEIQGVVIGVLRRY